MKIPIILLTLALSGLCEEKMDQLDNKIDQLDFEIDQLANLADTQLDTLPDDQLDTLQDDQPDDLQDDQPDNLQDDQPDNLPDDQLAISKEDDKDCPRRKFGQFCKGNRRNRLRGRDRYGSGSYNSRRGCRRHKGVDVRCRDGSPVYAPFNGYILGRAKVRGKCRYLNYGLILKGMGLIIEIHHIRPTRVRGCVRKGQLIGYMLRMQCYYPGITSHIHVQLRNKRNPTRYF